MECLIEWDRLEITSNGQLWRAILVPPRHYRIKLGPIEVYSSVHPLRLVLTIESLAQGAKYLLSNNFANMELEDEPDYTTLISSCGAFDGFFLLSLGLPEDFGVILKRENNNVTLCYPDNFDIPLPTYSVKKLGAPARELGECMRKATLEGVERLLIEIPKALRSEYLEWREEVLKILEKVE
ncbi:hypothetical protein [Palaeococcus ferrophilus]|uniref:hypothetical protein n=1 Tax=Palaeococcus ferrophilus TaxID=83868 RepID=UPI00064EA7D1|nr:hypothetical protein [Palaeococcus ferrophilus]